MARPTKVNRLVFASVIKEYITEDEKGHVSLSLSDREVAEELSVKLGIELNSEYIRNFRRSQNIAPGKTNWGGKREGAGRPPSINTEINTKEPQDVAGIIDMNSKHAIDRWHEKCVLALSRMYGGGDRYLYIDSEFKDRGRGTGKAGKGGGIKNVSHNQAYLAQGGQ